MTTQQIFLDHISCIHREINFTVITVLNFPLKYCREGNASWCFHLSSYLHRAHLGRARQGQNKLLSLQRQEPTFHTVQVIPLSMRSLKLPVLNIYEWECGSYWIYALCQKMKFHRIRERNGKYKFEFEAQCLHPLVMSGVFVFMITASTAAFQQLLNIKCRNHSEERVTRVQDDLAGTLSTESCIKNAASLTPRNPPSQLQLLTYLLLAFLRQGSCACGQI